MKPTYLHTYASNRDEHSSSGDKPRPWHCRLIAAFHVLCYYSLCAREEKWVQLCNSQLDSIYTYMYIFW